MSMWRGDDGSSFRPIPTLDDRERAACAAVEGHRVRAEPASVDGDREVATAVSPHGPHRNAARTRDAVANNRTGCEAEAGEGAVRLRRQRIRCYGASTDDLRLPSALVAAAAALGGQRCV